LCGCSVNFHVGSVITVTKPFSAKVTAKIPADLFVDVGIGDVTIKPGAADSSEVSVTGTLGGEDQATLDAVTVTVVQDAAGTTRIVAKGPNGKSWKADLTIDVPGKTSVTLNSGVGNVSFSALEGRMKADVGVGNLKVETLALSGDSSFKTGVGNVTLGIASWPKDSTLTADSGTGNATVRLPSNLGMTVDATTGTGSLKTSGIKFEGNPISKSVVGGSLKGRTTSEPEGRTLKIISGTGNVKIEGETAK